MSEPAADISAVVEYSMDKWVMDRIPTALWLCAAGLVIVLNSGGNFHGALHAVVYVALLGVALAGYAAAMRIERSGLSSVVTLPTGLLVAGLTMVVIVAVSGTLGGRLYTGRRWWSMLVDPPLHVLGWMLLELGLGWIAYAFYRHVYPGAPLVVLSPAGVSINRSWLEDLRIAWPDVRGVGLLEIGPAGGTPVLSSNLVAVLVTREHYERHIAPKVGLLAPPGAERMFSPRDGLMQVVLSQAELAVAPRLLREPAEARWKAFRDPSRPVSPTGGGQGQRIVYGRWSIEGSRRQAARFLAPLVGLAAVALHAAAAVWMG